MPEQVSGGFLTERLNELFKSRNVTYKQVIEGTNGAIQTVYLWQLRTGRAKNPGYKVIKALADFFGVEPGYFFEEQQKSYQEAVDEFMTSLSEDVEAFLLQQRRRSE